MTKILKEGFDHKDLVRQVDPVLSVDEYAAKMGDDDEIVTLAFTVKGQQASEDLVDWFERGYDYILDSQTSEGEITPGKYLVFVEMNRRTTVPQRIIDMIEDLETLTDLPVGSWKVTVDGEDYPAEVDTLKTAIILSPKQYRDTREQEEESSMNEMREKAGIETHKIFKEQDSLIRDFIAKAGL